MEPLLTFGEALGLMHEGYRMTRKNWNGPGMYCYLQKGYPQGIPCNAQTAKAAGLKEGDLFVCRPYFQLRTADGSFAMWTPNTSDILAVDWQVSIDLQ
jgi:hypothetical protein